MNMRDKKKLYTKLQNIVKEKPNTIESAVAEEALKYSENHEEAIDCFFNDLEDRGCGSGIVSSMIYCNDTHAFYDKYLDQIEDIRREYQGVIGDVFFKDETTYKNISYKNDQAWFAFEKVADDIFNSSIVQ